jgi:hypothetical protein
MKVLIPVEMIEKKILLIRSEKVMLDADLSQFATGSQKRRGGPGSYRGFLLNNMVL